MEVTISDVMAVAAFALSGFTLWRQRKGDELTRNLNALLIEKEQAESVSSKKADLFANFVKTGKSAYQFKVFNRGNASRPLLDRETASPQIAQTSNRRLGLGSFLRRHIGFKKMLTKGPVLSGSAFEPLAVILAVDPKIVLLAWHPIHSHRRAAGLHNDYITVLEFVSHSTLPYDGYENEMGLGATTFKVSECE